MKYPKRRHQPFDHKQATEMRYLYNAGWSYAAIAYYFNCSWRTIPDVLARNRIKEPICKRQRIPNKGFINKQIEIYEQRKRDRLKEILKKHGLKVE